MQPLRLQQHPDSCSSIPTAAAASRRLCLPATLPLLSLAHPPRAVPRRRQSSSRHNVRCSKASSGERMTSPCADRTTMAPSGSAASAEADVGAWPLQKTNTTHIPDVVVDEKVMPCRPHPKRGKRHSKRRSGTGDSTPPTAAVALQDGQRGLDEGRAAAAVSGPSDAPPRCHCGRSEERGGCDNGAAPRGGNTNGRRRGTDATTAAKRR